MLNNSWLPSVWISMQSFWSKSHNVAIVRKLEQSTSFPVGHHCKSLNNAKQTPNKTTVFSQVKSHLTVSRKLFPASSSITRVRSRWTLSGNELTGIYLLWIAGLWDLTVDYKTRSRSQSEQPLSHTGQSFWGYVKHFMNPWISQQLLKILLALLSCHYSNYMTSLHFLL